MTKIYQAKGSDGNYAIPNVGGDGLPLDLTGYANIALFLQYKNDITLLKKYDVESGNLTVLDATNGILSVIIQEADIKDWNKADIYKIVKTYETDEDYNNNVHKTSSIKSYFITITEDSSNE